MLPVCIHVGVPKTGTTTLQRGLFAQHTQIVYVGKPYDNPSESHEACQAVAELADSLWQIDELEFDHTRAEALFKLGIRNRQKRAGRSMVFSEEGLTNVIGADRACIARRLKRLFGPCRILITTRNQTDALLSGHRWCFARGFVNVSFDTWVRRCHGLTLYSLRRNECPLRQYLYGQLVRAYQDEFGEDRVLVLPLEMLKKNPSAYAHKLAGFLDIDEDQTHQLLNHTPAHNRSLSAWATRYQNVQRRVRRLCRRGSKADDAAEHMGLYVEGIHGRITRWLDRWSPPHREMSASTRVFLEEFYARDNRLLEQLCGEPLSDLGYAVAPL